MTPLIPRSCVLFIAAAGLAAFAPEMRAQEPTITLTDLRIRTMARSLTTPTGIAFLDRRDYFVIEKNTGKVMRVFHEAPSLVLDLGVNFASERGLLGIALHPNFPSNPSVYLFWTCVAQSDGTNGPPQTRCDEASFNGPDSDDLLRVPLLGNRVDRFEWDAVTERLVYRQNLIQLRSYQNDGVPTPPGQGDEGQPARGNHDGGVITFGKDGKLYVFFGDQGRRGQLQNLKDGPTGPLVPDDQFGGPQPDNAHLSGVILRLNDDGTTPTDNPFYDAGNAIGGEAGANIQRVYAYGLRNSFGLTIEPRTGLPWITEHGDDAFDEINRVDPGMNGGWVQLMGPLARIAQFKQIETTLGQPPILQGSLQQWRWPASRVADSSQEALSRMYAIPGSQYRDPQFSWKYAALPVGIEFIKGTVLGEHYQGNIFAGMVGNPMGPGYLIRIKSNESGTELTFDNSGLNDRVADNNAKYDLTESESLIVGSGFGIITDLETSPDGTLYVVSHTKGEIYEIYPAPGQQDDDKDGPGGRPLSTSLSGLEEVPGPGDPDGSGSARFILNQGQGQICYDIFVSSIAPATAAHIHRGPRGVAGPVVVPLLAPASGASSGCANVAPELIKEIRQNPEGFYVNVHNADYPAGAIRGQFGK
jgi:glucose/arabinose dehydrogenase